MSWRVRWYVRCGSVRGWTCITTRCPLAPARTLAYLAPRAFDGHFSPNERKKTDAASLYHCFIGRHSVSGALVHSCVIALWATGESGGCSATWRLAATFGGLLCPTSATESPGVDLVHMRRRAPAFFRGSSVFRALSSVLTRCPLTVSTPACVLSMSQCLWWSRDG